jgi:hypothetical protein
VISAALERAVKMEQGEKEGGGAPREASGARE